MEEFRDIKEYEGLYQVSNLGRIKNSKGLILKPHKDNSGYPMVNLCKNAKHIRVRVHRLVAETFISNPNNYPCVNHKDEDKSNNNVDNLEWCDYKYNATYGTALQRRVEKLKETHKNFDWSKITSKIDYKEVGRKNAEKLSKKVYQYTKDGEFVREWKSTKECERNGFHSGQVSNACVGRLKTYKGFIWTYDKNYIHKEITYDNRKPVFQFTLNGEFVREWATAAEANRNGFNSKKISLCCNGKSKTHKGFIWSYDKNYIHKEIVYKRHLKPVLQFTKDGEFVKEYSSTKECGRNGFNQGHVASCCNGKLKSHKGFIWRYK